MDNNVTELRGQGLLTEAERDALTDFGLRLTEAFTALKPHAKDPAALTLTMRKLQEAVMWSKPAVDGLMPKCPNDMDPRPSVTVSDGPADGS